MCVCTHITTVNHIAVRMLVLHESCASLYVGRPAFRHIICMLIKSLQWPPAPGHFQHNFFNSPLSKAPDILGFKSSSSITTEILENEWKYLTAFFRSGKSEFSLGKYGEKFDRCARGVKTPSFDCWLLPENVYPYKSNYMSWFIFMRRKVKN